MELLLKHKWNYHNIDTCRIKDDLKAFWIADITLDIIEGFNEFDQIEIIEVDQTDKIVFKWFIAEIEIDEVMSLTLNTNKALLYNKLLLSDKTYTNQTICQIFTDLLTSWNTTTWDNLTFNCDDTTLITKEFREWDNLFDILQELTELIGLNWNMQDREILVYESEKIDFTAFFNREEPFQTNIEKVILRTYWTQINIAIWSDWTTKTIKSDYTLLNERIWEYFSFREWDLETQTQQTLDIKKLQQREFVINLIEWLDLELWQKIDLVIENLDSYRNFNGEVFVIDKSIEYINGTKQLNIWVSNVVVAKNNFTWKLNNITKNIRLLKI